jgi:hypothetical protein
VPCGRATSKNDGAIENPLPRRADPARFPTLLRFFAQAAHVGRRMPATPHSFLALARRLLAVPLSALRRDTLFDVMEI